MPEPTSTAFYAAQRVLTAVNTLENCPSWPWFLAELDEIQKALAERCVTEEKTDTLAGLRFRCLQTRIIIKLLADRRATAEAIVKAAHEQKAVRHHGST